MSKITILQSSQSCRFDRQFDQMRFQYPSFSLSFDLVRIIKNNAPFHRLMNIRKGAFLKMASCQRGFSEPLSYLQYHLNMRNAGLDEFFGYNGKSELLIEANSVFLGFKADNVGV